MVIDATLYDDPTQYKCLAGALQYLTVTLPDLSFSVNQLCQHMRAPTVSHWEQLKRVLRKIHAFSDSDWASCPKDRKSTSGFAVFLGSNIVSWSVKKQRTVARYSTEAEYKALAYVCDEVTWIVSLLHEIKVSDYHFVRDKVAAGDIQVNFISTKDQLADIFTKSFA
ncbi:PREDICTED: uncharacterized protein LOC109168693 [Ipomoea nil]|uniref:uncharacterized protein LOC109168693 n=1 Tax=Ipomoea nil TaxID=35883 RepID=UPI0009013331|nr:PREDICTED: uncharacterized protein LOC109168693 [Ipomoea nil]